MNTSQQTAELMDALRAAQDEVPTIPKTKTADAGRFSYKYADLESTVSAVRPILSKCGLVVTQVPDWQDGADVLVTRLSHAASDQWIEGSLRLHESTSPQAQGSAITYARRYAYCAILGIVTDQDDDGTAAQHSQRPQWRSGRDEVQRTFPEAEPFEDDGAPPWDPEEATAPPPTRPAHRPMPASVRAGAPGSDEINEKMNKKIFALCASNHLHAGETATRILHRHVEDTRTLTWRDAKKVLDQLEAEGVGFPR